MRSTRWMLGAAVALLVAAAAGAAPVRSRQADPFAQLRTYDYQARQPVAAIAKLVQEAGTDPAKLAAIENGLLGVLKDPQSSLAGKQEACRFLWMAGSARCVPVLASMLKDDKLADMARYALERNADPSAAAALRRALAGATGPRLVGIVNSIGDRSDANAVGVLQPLTAGTDAAAADAAVTALGKIGTPAAVAVLQARPKDDLVASQALLRAAGSMAAAGKTAAAWRIYGQVAAEGRPVPCRVAALIGLAGTHSPKAAALGIAMMKSGSPYLQAAAARACGQMLTGPARQNLIATYPALPAPAQVALLSVWGDRRDAPAAKTALEAAHSADADVRAAGLYAAARCAGATAVPVLADVLAHGEGGDRGVARTYLAQMPGKEAAQAITQIAETGQPDVRASMMGVLADRGGAGTTATLLQVARGNDTTVAVAALKALGDVKDPTALPEVVKLLLSTTNDQVRDAAQSVVVSTAQRMGDRNQAADPLLAAFPTASTAARCSLLPVLAEVGGDRALEQLTKATASPDAEVKQAAVAALADTWSDDRPLDTLLTIAKSDGAKPLRVMALRGYIRIVGQVSKAPAEEKVVRLAQGLAASERPEEKRQVLGALRECRVEQAVALAGTLLDTEELFPEAAAAVVYLAAPQREGRTNLPAVRGAATTAAIEKVIRLAKDDNLRAQAEKLR